MKNVPNTRRIQSLAVAALLSAASSFAALPAFPGAEGFGMHSVGGRGGSVYHVSHLGDSGPGSFRDAVSQPNRTVVFDVGGTIRLKSVVFVVSNITVAGQTAPGGIELRGGGLRIGGSNNSMSSDVVFRHVRLRLPSGLKVGQTLDQVIPSTDTAALRVWNAEHGGDALTALKGSRLMFDHLSVNWGADGTFDLNTNFTTRVLDSVTIQNSIIAQGRIPHSTGGLLQTSGHVSVLRTLYANNWTRNPKVTANNQFVNNVIYNWGASSYNFGGADLATRSNIVGNYTINGPGGTRPGFMGGDSFVSAYLSDNQWDGNRNGVKDGAQFTAWSDSIKKVAAPFAFPALARVMPSDTALEWVLQNAGASLQRDAIDAGVVADVRSFGKLGVFVRTEDTLPSRGISGLVGKTASVDTDRDGMPDAWELLKRLDPNNPADGNAATLSPDGYTNLEMYLNELAGDPVAYRRNTAPKMTLGANWIVSTDHTKGFRLFANTLSDSENNVARIDYYVNGLKAGSSTDRLNRFAFAFTAVAWDSSYLVNAVAVDSMEAQGKSNSFRISNAFNYTLKVTSSSSVWSGGLVGTFAMPAGSSAVYTGVLSNSAGTWKKTYYPSSPGRFRITSVSGLSAGSYVFTLYVNGKVKAVKTVLKM